jgi:hypothetical protein
MLNLDHVGEKHSEPNRHYRAQPDHGGVYTRQRSFLSIYIVATRDSRCCQATASQKIVAISVTRAAP